MIQGGLTMPRILATAILASTILLASCRSTCADLPSRLRKDFAYKRSESYPSALDRAPGDRFMEAPAVLMDYLSAVDATDEYLSRSPSAAEAALFSEYLACLPYPLQDAFSGKVQGIYIIEGFKGSAMADYVFDASGAMFSILILNSAVFSESLDAWVAYRDASCLEPDSTACVSNSLGSGYRGLLYALCHETAHIYDYHRHATPWTEEHLRAISDLRGENEFTRGVWRNYGTPLSAYELPGRRKLSFFGFGDSISAQDLATLSGGLARTPFASAYGSKNWAEDFAETVTWFWLSEKLGLSYAPTLELEAGLITTYNVLDNPLARARWEGLKRNMGMD